MIPCPACDLAAEMPDGTCPNTQCPRRWVVNPAYDRAFVLAHPYSLLSWAQGLTLYEAVQAAPPGPVAELGVYKGGSAMLLHYGDPARRLHLFDTFTGHPDVWNAAHDRVGSHAVGSLGDTSALQVAQRLTGIGAQVETWIGVFPIDYDCARLPRFSVVHVDVDLWASVRAALTIFPTQLLPGGVLIVDDYGTDECPGVKEAVEAFIAVAGPAWCVERTAYPTYQAVLRKVAGVEEAYPPESVMPF